MTFQHHPANGSLPGLNLLAQAGHHQRLAFGVFLTVAVTAIHDKRGRQVRICQVGGSGLHRLGAEVGSALLAAAQYKVAVWVALRLQNGRGALLGQRREPVAVGRGANGIDGHVDLAVGAVLEAHGHGQPGCQLAVNLAFHGSGANGAKTHQVGVVLTERGVQELTGGCEPQFGHVKQYPAGEMQALVDMEAAIQVGVIDEALPAHHRTRFFEVDPEHGKDGVRQRLTGDPELVGKIQKCSRVVHGAGADYRHHAPVTAREDGLDRPP